MEERYFPSRWRSWVIGLGVAFLVLAVIEALVVRPPWVGLVHVAIALSTLGNARRLGVWVSDEGVRWRRSRWSWHEIRAVDVIDEEFVRNAPRQVVLRLDGDESVRLGRLPGREAMVDAIRQRLP